MNMDRNRLHVPISPRRIVNDGRLLYVGVKDDLNVTTVVFEGIPTYDDLQLVTLHFKDDIVPLEREGENYLWEVAPPLTEWLENGKEVGSFLRVTVGEELRWNSRPFKIAGYGIRNEESPTPSDGLLNKVLGEVQGLETLLDRAEGAAEEAAEAATQVVEDKEEVRQLTIRAETAEEGAAASLDSLTNLTATAETLSPSSPATVAKTTTPDGYALAFGIPRGDKGDKGDTGEQGIQGIQGIQGPKGDKGDTGEQGIQGIQGPMGPEGAKGEPGEVTIVQMNETINEALSDWGDLRG